MSLLAENIMIQVHALEVNNGVLDPGMNLFRLTSVSGGSHLSVNSENIGAGLNTFIQEFVQATKSPIYRPSTMKPVR